MYNDAVKKAVDCQTGLVKNSKFTVYNGLVDSADHCVCDTTKNFVATPV